MAKEKTFPLTWACLVKVPAEGADPLNPPVLTMHATSQAAKAYGEEATAGGGSFQYLDLAPALLNEDPEASTLEGFEVNPAL